MGEYTFQLTASDVCKSSIAENKNCHRSEDDASVDNYFN